MYCRNLCVCVALAILASLLNVEPALANRYSNVRVGQPVWLPFQPQRGERVENNLMHSPKNLDVFEKCFSRLPATQAYLSELNKIRNATLPGSYRRVTRPSRTVYVANFAVMWLSNQSRNGSVGAYYQVLRCQNSASDQQFTDYGSRQLRTVPGSSCGISDQTCWNFLVAMQPLYVERGEAAPMPRRPEEPMPRSPRYEDGNASYVEPSTPPIQQPPVILREVTTKTIEVTRTIIHQEGLQANPGAATIAPTLQEQPGVVTTYGGLYFGLSGSSNRSRSQTRSTRCPPCPRCQPRPTPRPGGFRPPLGGQPRTDSGNGSPPSGQPRPGY